MDFNNPSNNYSPSSSSSSTLSTRHPPPTASATMSSADPIQSWWETVSKARSRILSLSSLLPCDPSSPFSLSSLADSDNPVLSLLSSPEAYSLFSSSLSAPSSGSGSDPLCQWLYETYLSSDPHLRLVVLSFLPLLCGLYLGRLHSSDSTSTPPLAGFEAVLLAIYSSEAKSRAGKPIFVQIPDLSVSSLYHSPQKNNKHYSHHSRPAVGLLSAPLEPQIAVKSTKRPVIIGVVLDCYFNQISQMPGWSKRELCVFAAQWAGQDCACKDKLDGNHDEHGPRYLLEGREGGAIAIAIEDVEEEMERKVRIEEEEEKDGSEPVGVRIPLPWEVLQPLLRIIGHCLLAPLNPQDVKDAASVAVRRLYARASHDLAPQAILATRSLIQLDKRARETAKEAAAAVNSSNANTPSKAKKPEVLLVSK